jgi:hypothetical protein
MVVVWTLHGPKEISEDMNGSWLVIKGGWGLVERSAAAKEAAAAIVIPPGETEIGCQWA